MATKQRSNSHWWKDQFARLVITIVGGVVAALILAFVIPALASQGDGGSEGEAPAESTEAPAEGSDSSTDSGGEPAADAESTTGDTADTADTAEGG